MRAAITRLFVALPFLGWGPIGWIATLIIERFSAWLYEAIKLAVNLELIAFRNDEHRKAFDQASVVLKIIAHDKGIDSPEFRKARDEAKIALSRFVQFAH